MPNLTHSFDSPSISTTTAEAPRPSEGHHALERALALLVVPFIVVGYHVAVTVLKLTGRRRG